MQQPETGEIRGWGPRAGCSGRALGPRGQVGPPSPSPGPNPGPENPARGRPRRSDRDRRSAVGLDCLIIYFAIDSVVFASIAVAATRQQAREAGVPKRFGEFGVDLEPIQVTSPMPCVRTPHFALRVRVDLEKAGRHSVGPSYSHGGALRDTLTFGLATYPAGATTEPRLTHPLGPAATDCPCGLAGAHPERGRSAPIAACSGGHSGGHSAGHN